MTSWSNAGPSGSGPTTGNRPMTRSLARSLVSVRAVIPRSASTTASAGSRSRGYSSPREDSAARAAAAVAIRSKRSSPSCALAGSAPAAAPRTSSEARPGAVTDRVSASRSATSPNRAAMSRAASPLTAASTAASSETASMTVRVAPASSVRRRVTRLGTCDRTSPSTTARTSPVATARRASPSRADPSRNVSAAAASSTPTTPPWAAITDTSRSRTWANSGLRRQRLAALSRAETTSARGASTAVASCCTVGHAVAGTPSRASRDRNARTSTTFAGLGRGTSSSATPSTPSHFSPGSARSTRVVSSRLSKRSRHCRTRAWISRRYCSPRPGIELIRRPDVVISSETVARSSRCSADRARGESPASESGVVRVARAAASSRAAATASGSPSSAAPRARGAKTAYQARARSPTFAKRAVASGWSARVKNAARASPTASSNMSGSTTTRSSGPAGAPSPRCQVGSSPRDISNSVTATDHSSAARSYWRRRPLPKNGSR